MEDIDCDDNVLVDDDVLIEGICEECHPVKRRSMLSNRVRKSADDQLDTNDDSLNSPIVIMSKDDNISNNANGSHYEENYQENVNEQEQTYIFTIDGDSGMFHATPVNMDVKTSDKSSKNNSLTVGQAWFTSRNDKNKLHKNGEEWKQGMWSKEEIALLDSNIKNYCVKHNLTDPAEIIFEMTKDERKDFYRTISNGLNRPLFSIYRRVIRMYDKKNHVGRYTSNERTKLKKLHEKHGNDWQTIGIQLGRSASSIKDKCRIMKDNCNTGKWFPEEEKLLTDAVYELSNATVGEVVSTGISWTQVAERVKTRSEKQCRTKWLNYLNWKHTGGLEWTREDDVKLVTKMCNLDVTDENEIDWVEMATGWKSVRSPQWLRGKWWNLKRHITNVQSLQFKDVCSQLYAHHVENTKLVNSLVSSETETGALEPEIELVTSSACLSLPQVRFVSIPNVVQIPSSVDLDVSNGVASDSVTAALKTDAGSSIALQTFEIVSPNLQIPTSGHSGTFFITSQGTAIQYPSDTLSSTRSIILQTLAADSTIQMNIPTQLIIANSSNGLVSSSALTEEHSEVVSQFSQPLQLSSDDVNVLRFDENTLADEVHESNSMKTVQADLVKREPMSPDFILSDSILQETNENLTALEEDEVLTTENINEGI